MTCKDFGKKCPLEITLKSNIRLLDIQKIDLIPRLGRKWFAYARENRFDGIRNKELVLLFGNKMIQDMKIMK